MTYIGITNYKNGCACRRETAFKESDFFVILVSQKKRFGQNERKRVKRDAGKRRMDPYQTYTSAVRLQLRELEIFCQIALRIGDCKSKFRNGISSIIERKFHNQ